MKTSLWKSHVLVYSSLPSTLVHLKGQFTENTNQSECVCLSEFCGEFRGFGAQLIIWGNNRNAEKKAQRSNCVSSQTVSALKGSVCVLVPLIFPDSVLFLWLRTVGNARSLDCSSAFSDLDQFRLKWLQFVIRHLSIKCFIATTKVFKTFLKYYNPDLVL